MAQEIEIEFKNLLSKTEFTQLLEALFSDVYPITQVNYYFETPDFQLKRQQSALRIRKKDEKYVLTLKEPHTKGLLETHEQLTKDEANAWFTGNPISKEQIRKQLKSLGISIEELQYFGDLTTTRYERNYKETTLVIDHSQYNNTEDFELELEANSWEIGERTFKELLQNYDIIKRETPNKIRRFFASKK